MNNRWVEIGDLLVQKSDGKKYFGVVSHINCDHHGHASVLIEWATPPPDYIAGFGYARSNIHNLHRTFQVFKA